MVTKNKAPKALKVRLSRDAIIAEAIRQADQHGIDGLSMRRLAEMLGVEAMSLYNHIRNKEDLLSAMVDTVVSQMQVPATEGRWREEVRAAAMSSHLVLMKHPWATMLLVSRPNIGPAKLKHFDATQGCLCNAGFSVQMADQIRNVIDGHLYGFTLQKLLYPTKEGDFSQAAAQFLPMLPQKSYPHSHALVKAVSEGRYDGKHYFEFGLDLLLQSAAGILASQSLP